MNNNIREILSQSSALGNDIEQVLEFLDRPDEEFDAIYPAFKKKFSEILNSPEMKKNLLSQVKGRAIEDIESERESFQELIEVFKSEDSLSKNKKDFLVFAITAIGESVFGFIENPREKIPVKICKINDSAMLPVYAHNTDAGADVFANETLLIEGNSTAVIKTGLKVIIPTGYEIQIRPRSGMSLNTPLRIANAPGTIDSSFRGEIGIIVHNTSNEPIEIKTGMKIAQMVIAETPMILWEEVSEVEDDTERGSGGFGSTGV